MDINENPDKEQLINEAVIKALNHKIRRNLLLELYKHGWGGYSELSKSLDIKAGGFYHHMRLLEESGLVKQLEDKLYEITPLGAQASEFIRGSFSPLDESRFYGILRVFNPISSKIDSFPLISIIFQLVILSLGLFWLVSEHQILILGYFIVSFDETSAMIIYSLIFTILGLSGLYFYFMIIYKRLLNRITFISHLLFPVSIFVGLITFLSLTPALEVYNSIPSAIAIIFTFIYQFISITYYIHIFQKSKIRLLGRVMIVLLLQQYYYLIVLFVFF